MEVFVRVLEHNVNQQGYFYCDMFEIMVLKIFKIIIKKVLKKVELIKK